MPISAGFIFSFFNACNSNFAFAPGSTKISLPESLIKTVLGDAKYPPFIGRA